MARSALDSEKVYRRAKVVNVLIDWNGVWDGMRLQRIEDHQDLDMYERRMYEQLLGLREGALGWGRFTGEFAGWSFERIASYLLSEDKGPEAVEEQMALSATWEEQLTEGLEFAGIQPGQMLCIAGADDLRTKLKSFGATVPRLRNAPSQAQLQGYPMMVVCPGPVGHKETMPWTEPIRRMPAYRRPIVIPASSNVSGMAREVYDRRVELKEYVDLWKSA